MNDLCKRLGYYLSIDNTMIMLWNRTTFKNVYAYHKRIKGIKNGF